MRYMMVVLLCFNLLHATKENKWATIKNCEACHQSISKHWQTSRHANAHFSKNELYKKSLEYFVAKNPERLIDEMKIKCAKCHNPKISKTNMSDEEKILLSLEDEGVSEAFKKMLNSIEMQQGINCTVCHNVEKIHFDKTKGSQGLEGVTFGREGKMFGPFSDAYSPYHKTAYKEYFSDSSTTLCFTCHYSYQNEHGIEVYSTGKEYDSVKSNEGCKDCHMSKKYAGVASDYVPSGTKSKSRMVRKHRFASINNSTILQEYLDINAFKEAHQLLITLNNRSPHTIPTGYGLREITITAVFYDANKKQIQQQHSKLTALWHDKEGKPTLPFMATQKVQDTRLPAKSTQTYRFDIPKGASKAKYILSYRFINQAMSRTLELKDPFFTQAYRLMEGELAL